jgi:hypothetical protein
MVAAFAAPAGARAEPDVAAILRANELAEGAAPRGATTVTTTYAFHGMGLTGRYVSTDDLNDGRFVSALTLGPVSQIQGFDGKHAWLKETSGSISQQDGGEQRMLAVSEAYRQANLWWRADRGGARIIADGVRRDGARSLDVLSVTPPGGQPFEAGFDTDTHLLARTVWNRGAQTVGNAFSDYRSYEGQMQAGTVIVDSGDGPRNVFTLTLAGVAYGKAAGEADFSAPQSRTADTSIAGGKPETSLPFRLVDNRVYAKVSVNGEGPFLFLFDTGATNTITRSLAARLGIAWGGRAAEQGAGEGVAEAGFAKVAALDIAGARIKDQVVGVDPDDLQTVEAVGDQGVIGFETFRRFVVRLDYEQGLITLIDPKTFDAKDAGTPIRFDFEGNILQVAGEFEGVPARLVVDTGSRAEVVLNRPFVERNHLRDKHPKGVDGVAGWGVGGPAYAYATRGTSLAVGPIAIGDVVALFSTQEKGAFAGGDFDGEIGGGVLKRFVVTFDYARQTLYLKPRGRPPDDVGTFDRAGMWFNASEVGFRIVDVARNGPAAEAGLAPGDEIVGFDGKPAKDFTVSDLRRRLRLGRPGTDVTFTIRRSGREHIFTVTLRDLI